MAHTTTDGGAQVVVENLDEKGKVKARKMSNEAHSFYSVVGDQPIREGPPGIYWPGRSPNDKLLEEHFLQPDVDEASGDEDGTRNWNKAEISENVRDALTTKVPRAIRRVARKTNRESDYSSRRVFRKSKRPPRHLAVSTRTRLTGTSPWTSSTWWARAPVGIGSN